MPVRFSEETTGCVVISHGKRSFSDRDAHGHRSKLAALLVSERNVHMPKKYRFTRRTAGYIKRVQGARRLVGVCFSRAVCVCSLPHREIKYDGELDVVVPDPTAGRSGPFCES